MQRVNAFARLAIIVGMGASIVSGDVIYDSKGFEEFEGYIADDGQDGWYPDEGVWPYIWPGPPSRGAKSVQLRVYMAEHLTSGMWRDTPDLLAQGYQRVTVSFEVYRPTPKKSWYPEFGWGVGGEGNPVYGGQWTLDAPLTSRTYPFIDTYDPFTHDPSVNTVVDRWTTVELTWDFDAGIAFGFYDGVLVTEKEIENFDSLYGFSLVGQHGGGTPDMYYEEYIWIDNFIMTAEVSRCYPDFTGDGGLDLFDFLAYVNAFNAGDVDADCDGGGGLDLFDFLCFVNAFNAGC